MPYGLPPAFSVTPTLIKDQTSCTILTPNGSATASVGGVTAGFTFDWFKGQSTLVIDQVATNTITPANLTNSVYTVRATKTSTGCTATNEITINQNLIYPVVTLTPTPNSICDIAVAPGGTFVGKVQANVTGGSAGNSFVWYNGNTTLVAPRLETIDNIIQLNGGDYTLIVTNTTSGCATGAVTTTVTNNTTLPTLSTSQTPSTNCVVGKEDGTANVTQVNGVLVAATTNFNYQWHTGIGCTSN